MSLIALIVAVFYMINADREVEQTPFLEQQRLARLQAKVARFAIGALTVVVLELFVIWVADQFQAAPSLRAVARLSLPLLVVSLVALFAALYYMINADREAEQAPFADQRQLALVWTKVTRFAVGALVVIVLELIVVWTVDRFQLASVIAAPAPTPSPSATATYTPTKTLTPTATATLTPTMTPTLEPTPIPTATPAPPTSTLTLTPTLTLTVTPSSTSTPEFTFYVIQAGDSFSKLARRFGTTIEAIREANPDVDPYKLPVGQEVRIPRAIITPTAMP